MKRLQPRSSSAFTLIELLFVVAMLAILMALLSSAFDHMRVMTGRVNCQKTLRNLHGRFLAYAQDHNNCLPVGYISSANLWVTHLTPYFETKVSKTEGEAYCPITRPKHPDGRYLRDRSQWRTDYNVNGNVLTATREGNRLALIPGNLVFLYDGGGSIRSSAADARATFRHPDRANVLFVDGHLETLTAFDSKLQRWTR